MRIILLILSIMILFSTSLFSVENSSNDIYNNKLKSIKYCDSINIKEIQLLVKDLSFEERSKLFYKNIITFEDVTTESLFNFVPSLGSWIVGDYGLAIMIDVLLVLTGGAAITGELIKNDDIKYTSLGGLTGFYISGLFLPALMAFRFNSSLQDALILKMPLVFNDDINRMNFSKFNEAYFHIDLVSCSF